MKYQRLNLERDYPAIKWMFQENWNGSYVEKESLPVDGVVAIDEELGIVGATFLYMTSNSFLAIVGYPLLSTKLKNSRGNTLRKMLELLEFHASYSGYKQVHTWSGTEAIKHILKDVGYVEGDEDVTNYVKNLI